MASIDHCNCQDEYNKPCGCTLTRVELGLQVHGKYIYCKDNNPQVCGTCSHPFGYHASGQVFPTGKYSQITKGWKKKELISVCSQEVGYISSMWDTGITLFIHALLHQVRHLWSTAKECRLRTLLLCWHICSCVASLRDEYQKCTQIAASSFRVQPRSKQRCLPQQWGKHLHTIFKSSNSCSSCLIPRSKSMWYLSVCIGEYGQACLWPNGTIPPQDYTLPSRQTNKPTACSVFWLHQYW